MGCVSVQNQLSYWTRTDHLEMAMERLRLAEWEHRRLVQNKTLSIQESIENRQQKLKFLRSGIRVELSNFGLSSHRIDLAMHVLEEAPLGSQGRTRIDQISPANVRHVMTHEQHGIEGINLQSRQGDRVLDNQPAAEQVGCSDLTIKRWLPDLFMDILYEHTLHVLNKEEIIECGIGAAYLSAGHLSAEGFMPTRTDMSSNGRKPMASRLPELSDCVKVSIPLVACDNKTNLPIAIHKRGGQEGACIRSRLRAGSQMPTSWF